MYIVKFYKPQANINVYLASFDKKEDAEQFKIMREKVSKYKTFIEYSAI